MHLGPESMSSQVPRGSPEHARRKRRKRRCFPASVANKGERDEKVTWTERALIWNIHGGRDNQIQCACSVESCKIYVSVVFRMFTTVYQIHIYIYILNVGWACRNPACPACLYYPFEKSVCLNVGAVYSLLPWLSNFEFSSPHIWVIHVSSNIIILYSFGCVISLWVGNHMIFPYCHSHAPVIPYPGCIEISQLLCHSCPYPIYPSLLHLITVLSNFIHLLVALGSSWACSGHGIHIQIVVTCLGWAFRVPGSQWLVRLQFGSSSQFLKFSHQWIRIHDCIDLKRMAAILFGLCFWSDEFSWALLLEPPWVVAGSASPAGGPNARSKGVAKDITGICGDVRHQDGFVANR